MILLSCIHLQNPLHLPNHGDVRKTLRSSSEGTSAFMGRSDAATFRPGCWFISCLTWIESLIEHRC
jgi:hypothetical protein